MSIREFSLPFISQELLEKNFLIFKGDVWSLGCVVYFIISGAVLSEKGSREKSCKNIKLYIQEK